MSKTHAEFDILQEEGHGHSPSLNFYTFLLKYPTKLTTLIRWFSSDES